jgi:hypothetical protein
MCYKLRPLVITAGLAATAWMTLTAPAPAASLYRCQAKDAVALEDDGTLGRRKRHKTIIIDSVTGAVRLGDDTPGFGKSLRRVILKTTS